MKQEKSESRLGYETAVEAMRAAQTEFDLRRGEVVAVRERVNRLRMAASDAEAAATEAKEQWEEAFRGTDGVLTPELKQLRSVRRDAHDLLEDYRNLLADAEANARHTDLPALEVARAMEMQRLTALELLAQSEIEKAFAEIAPRLRLAVHMIDMAHAPGGIAAREHTPYIDPQHILDGVLRIALKSVPIESIQLPEDLGNRANIAPLRWADASSMIEIKKRTAEAKTAGFNT